LPEVLFQAELAAVILSLHFRTVIKEQLAWQKEFFFFNPSVFTRRLLTTQLHKQISSNYSCL